VLLVWLLLAALSASLALRAAAAPPRGTVFVGTFYFVDDFYNYLGHAEQAQRGALLLRSKLAPPGLPAALLNVEWLAVGWLAALLGGRLLLAYRVVGLAALALLVAASDRLLVRGGLEPPRRLAGLLLVFTGGGLGGLLVALHRLDGARAFDVRTGAFPFVEALANPHFVVGTALLAAAVAAFADGRPRLGVALGTVLGLARPYDALLLAGIEGLAVLLLAPARDWPRRLLPVLALVPVLAYSAWLFLLAPGFKVFSSPRYGALAPSALEALIAFGPALALALTAGGAWRGATALARAHLSRLAIWAALAGGLVALRPVSFSLQFMVGLGLPLLALAALGLGRLRRGGLELAVPLLAGTAVFVAWLCTAPIPSAYASLTRWQLTRSLAGSCRPGDLLLAPADIGLYAGGLTACWPYLSHAAAPDATAREATAARFYDPATPPEDRRAILEEICPAHVVLPAALPEGWLGAAGRYRPKLTVTGERESLAVWSRDRRAPCGPR
jgi:hypothetical protein